MASTSADEKALWRDGDSCLAPNAKSGTLLEGTIQRLSTNFQNNETTAWVIFADHNKDAEKEEEAIPVSKLLRPSLNHFTQEKPFFPSIVTDPGLNIPLELSDVEGDRVPYTINRYLRDYQRDGIRFLFNNFICSRGCILGDDMGLGKTVQVIGFLAAVLQKTGTWEDIKNNRPQFLQSQMPSNQSKLTKVFLIVAPLSVLYNWKDELDTWGHFQVVVVHGLRKEEELARIKRGRTEIALTTYETLRLCLDQFNDINWSAVIVDEAHKIKNPNSQITQAMKELRCKIRIGLTGTILQNNLEELWCVMDWATPGCLGSLGNFKNKFSDPIEQGQRHNATKRDLATGRKTVRALVRKISHSFLRRTKALIKEQLPKKDDRVVYCSLTDFQQTLYQTVLDTEDVTLLLRSSEKCDCQSGHTRRNCCYKTNSEGVHMKGLYFSYLAILRKVANHAALLQSTTGTSKKQEKYVRTICQKVFQKFPDFVQRCKDEAFEALSDPVYSGKMKVLQKLFKYYMLKRDKVLLFSFSTKLLDVLESYCMAEGLDYSRLDGTTKSKERIQIVKEFNSSSHTNLCLVSTMAGGLGLNFVGANVVVLFDPTWNPANDLQAIDRAYRIGQCRDVTVLRLISLGTVEEVIYLRQVYKQQLQSSVVGKESARRYFEAVQGHGVHKGELFGIKNLFRLQTQGTCLTRQILEREGQVEAGVVTTSTHTVTQKKEEERKGASGPGDCSSTHEPVPNYETAKKDRDASENPGAVLDFSSGSEEDEERQGFKRRRSNPNALDGIREANAATGPGRMNLLQHGFSKLFEKANENPELSDGDSSPSVEFSPSDTEAKEQINVRKKDSNTSGISKTGNSAVCLPKLGTKTWNISSSSDRKKGSEYGGNKRVSLLKERGDVVKQTQGLNRWTYITADEDSNENSTKLDKKPVELNTTVSTVHRLEGYSDESEDFDLEETMWSKKVASDSHHKDKRRGRLDCNRKRRSASVRNKARSKYTENIEKFTSSDDELTPVKKGCRSTSPQKVRSPVDMLEEGRRPTTDKTARHAGMLNPVSFTSLKTQASPTSKRNQGTIDSVLGGLQEVVYTHSNQRVVGGSKAEELISKAAVRDVFERRMYSQLPANHLLGTQERLSLSPPESQPCPAIVRLKKPSVDHPVTFTSKRVDHTKYTTFITGETPQAICRQQLEEMAKKFNFPSVNDFAVEILKRDSSQRVAWLRQYYTSLDHPDLAKIVTKTFPQPDSAQYSSSSSTPSTSTKTAATKSHAETRTALNDVPKATKKPKYTPKNQQLQTKANKSRNPQNEVPESRKKQRVPQKNALDLLTDVSSPVSDDGGETACSARGHKRTKRGSVCSSGTYRAGGGLGVDRASSSGLGSGETAALLNRADRDTPSSRDVSHGRSTALSKPTAQGKQQEQKLSSRTNETFQGQSENFPPQQTPSACSSHSFLTDLIGDTSILDDLFKPKPREAQPKSTPKTAPIPSSLSVRACLSTPSQTRTTLNTHSGSTCHLDSPSSPSSHTSTHPANTQVQASKGSRKDFWDILNEGNEESINRLTDPEEVQRVCISTNILARSRSKEEESKSLWKTNENFLWKK
ncbi:DNA excision repair protein ERCC-6-like 2 isoform X2 [Channa argus]|uniref:DNA excision repair protein ERCC-6-like 2 isoform X2 n=1 Tax=Channa argus TaxID=215402 RepID=UPI00352216F0